MRGDRRGPENIGPRTGRGLGYCAGYARAGSESGNRLMSMRRGRGPGPERGYRSGFRGGDCGDFGRDYDIVQAVILKRLDRIEEKLNKEY